MLSLSIMQLLPCNKLLQFVSSNQKRDVGLLTNQR